MKFLFKTTAFLFMTIFLFPQTEFPEINNEIQAGNFTKVENLIKQKLISEISAEEKYELEFQIEKMYRIRRDFKRDRDYVKNALQKYYPDLTGEMLDTWEKDNSLEMMMIDGEKRYFNNAVPNLFRINKEAKARKIEIDGSSESNLRKFLRNHLPESVKMAKESGKEIINPARMKIKYTLTVDADAVPDGEIIRCWLPYPKENHKRQTDVKLISVNSNEYIVADDSNPQRTLYLEKIAEAGKPTVFQMELEYTAYSEWHDLQPENIKPYNKDSEIYKEFTSEKYPHIIFTDEIKALAKKIVGDETNPYLKVKKIFQWISDEIPWASAREYSTLDNISSYCISNMHGDCGIQALTFITLARCSGIPAKWQSGWMTHPGSLNLHDWSEVYFEDIGWVPVDADYGEQDSDDEAVKYYYSSGMDSYRFIVNDDYAQPIFPAKIYPRSETNDFQRGEVEWKGGNLYFDKWDYHMDVEYLSAE